MSLNTFTAHYQKWYKRKKYNFSKAKAEEIHKASKELVPVLPKDDFAKLTSSSLLWSDQRVSCISIIFVKDIMLKDQHARCWSSFGTIIYFLIFSKILLTFYLQAMD